VETLIRNGDLSLERVNQTLVKSKYVWYGKNRSRGWGGGVGFLVDKACKVKVAKENINEGIFWIEIDLGVKFYCAVVYLVPNDRLGLNDDTVLELQRDVVFFKTLGLVLIFG